MGHGRHGDATIAHQGLTAMKLGVHLTLIAMVCALSGCAAGYGGYPVGYAGGYGGGYEPGYYGGYGGGYDYYNRRPPPLRLSAAAVPRTASAVAAAAGDAPAATAPSRSAAFTARGSAAAQ